MVKGRCHLYQRGALSSMREFTFFDISIPEGLTGERELSAVPAPSLSRVRAFSFYGANLVPIKACEHFRFAVQKFFFAILHR